MGGEKSHEGEIGIPFIPGWAVAIFLVLSLGNIIVYWTAFHWIPVELLSRKFRLY